MRFIVLAVLLTGCSDHLVKVAEPQSVLITWERVKPTHCPDAGQFYGCAERQYDYALCTIRMPEDAPDWVVAEEFRHCFAFEHAK